ncbi:DUF1474 family protein [Staphylococcus saprophyticus]|uniref:type II toxin-antitoxin system toxin TscT n=1 Tax=Staphylococcus saprophyticus TaxID=29385 RepID=UPI00297B4E6D|nr:DUF1474 family protein [Staphylococcus saprophyticus]MDW4166525.1 DUF1474 family protein [Staphylococcus saprophyticus]MDW4302046.1 DUF1474 family protein [Staphylococcus saprophyticus]MDW4460285.1 DUF1474 family protein [Staphylococcus saprophyticus]MEB5647593.1 DUF1474 family protein [Staphylococcus saprophyticus]
MEFEVSNLFCDLEIIKNKLEDLTESYGWFVEDYYIENKLENLEEVKSYGMRYKEHRIYSTQTLELLLSYMKDFDKLVDRMHELEKNALSQADQSEDNA